MFVVRRDIVKLLGLLFGSQRSRLAEDIPELWTAYMARYNDVGEEVRLVCVTLSLNILIYHPELRGQVSLLAFRCHDTNDRIRLESLTVIRKLALSKFEALNEELLNCLAGRIRDKKVRFFLKNLVFCLSSAAAIHKLVYFTESERASVAVIMQRILSFYYQPYLDDRLLIERLFVSSFLPFKTDPKKRMAILFEINFLRSLEEIFSQQSRFRRLIREILQTLDGEEQSLALIQSRVQIIAESYGTPAKIAVYFQ
ncbi:unnamed protein product [Enterobius vermicularis]|uniref:Condensin complex subunit 1 C-terminal domain-containing protein n=1 Tax=Enterobius vermicularis TaxID=51028 RepID=A0A3P6I8N1_ENTVE|nr:unnamed protein product [Enterobius vermicularis]